MVAARNLLEAGLEATVFEASDGIGGQWYAAADHSGVWPGMRTNTSRAMTAFSDLPYAPDLELHPTAEQIQAYLTAYASAFDLHRRIRLGTRVRRVEPGWRVDGEPFDAVVVASGRFGRPVMPSGFDRFTGRLLHAFDYPGADAFADGRTLVYGNGVSGHEIAADIAPDLAPPPVISAYRKPRYVLQKNVRGVSSDWQWYTHFGALQRRALTPADFGRLLRDRVVVRVAGNPADFGAPRPDDDILVAGHSLSQDYLRLVRDGRIVCRPAIAAVDGRTVTFTDGTTETVDTIVCATGYDLHLPYLPDEVWRIDRSAARPAPSDDSPRPAGLRRDRAVRPAGSVLPAARAAGAVDRRVCGPERSSPPADAEHARSRPPAAAPDVRPPCAGR